MVNGMSGSDGKRSDRKVAESIARDLVRTIVDNELPPGSPLPGEADMIADYAVGRATLREALRLLETQGVITLRRGPRGGPFVADVTASDFAEPMALHLEIARATYKELFDARLALEPLMTRLAATHPTTATVERLKAIVETEDETDLSDDAAFERLSQVFHATLAGISGSRVLNLLGQSMKIVYDTGIRPAAVPMRQRPRVREAHRAIAEAIIEGRADDAERFTRSLLVDYQKAARRNQPGQLTARVTWM
jgi:DNA-binding FadR family transcriptional regulator